MTLSTEQLAYAQQRLAERGLRRQDPTCGCRTIATSRGTFDRIVSIEMLEAVGEAYWPTYFDKLRQRLTRRRGRAPGHHHRRGRFDTYRRRRISSSATSFRAACCRRRQFSNRRLRRRDCGWFRPEFFGASYARTLAEWHARFLQAWPQSARWASISASSGCGNTIWPIARLGFEIGVLNVGLYKIERRGCRKSA